MELIVMRHGHAEPFAKRDAERALTSRGREEVASVAQAIAAMGVQPSQILASPYVRAQQSAEIFARAFDEREVATLDALVPEARADETLAALPRTNCLVLLSHMPLVSELLGRTLCGSAHSALPLATACAVLLDITHPASRDGKLLAALSPRIAARLVRGCRRDA